MEATISGASVVAGDCTQVSRRRNLLTASSATLEFEVTVSGAAAATATASSVADTVSAAVNDGSFETALTDAAAALSVTGFEAPTVSADVVANTQAPTPAPTAATGTAPTTPTTPTTPTPPTTPTTPAPTASPVTSVLSGSWRVAPGVGLLGTCIAALATAWV